MEHKVYFMNAEAGVVTTTQEGLYVRLYCRCQGLSEGMYDLMLGDRRLGLLRPEGRAMTLMTRLPARQMTEGEFRLKQRHPELEGRFVPLCPQEPFGYLRQLRQAVFAKENGQPGIFLKSKKM